LAGRLPHHREHGQDRATGRVSSSYPYHRRSDSSRPQGRKGIVMGSFSIWHGLIVLVIVLLIFGTKKLRNIGADLGGAVKGFKDGMKSADEKPEAKTEIHPGAGPTIQRA